ncbi:Zn(II)2Cys6 transcription factor domain-containing protein CYBJADRAFT_126098, partial [Cyberlindnera jadinii NRRL Y-1542]
MEAADKPKKRQRMSVVCLNCKTRKIKCDKKRPACSNCVKCNVGHLCEYEPPHWVTRA